MRLPLILEGEKSTISLYHGGTQWRSRPEIRPAKKGRYECGPGIYFTTSYMRALDYAGGSKVVQVAQIDKSRIVVPWKVVVELTDVKELLDNIRLKNRKVVWQGIQEYASKRELRATIVINWLINQEALGGDSGPAVAQWLKERGATADVNVFHSEEWLIVFDPSIILSHRKVEPKEASGDFPFNLPLFSHEIDKH